MGALDLDGGLGLFNLCYYWYKVNEFMIGMA